MSILYQPKGRAGEYAKWAVNIYRGCGHACAYCYAPQVLRMTREDFTDAKERAGNFLGKLRKESAKTNTGGEPVLLCFTTDPYQPLNDELGLTRQVIEILKSDRHNFQVLTKGGPRTLWDLDLYRPGLDAFASTLTLLDKAASLKWEPNAADPDDRLYTLREFHAAGIKTWTSLEPVIDPAVTLEIIRQTHEYVDHYKVGKINYTPAVADKIDWRIFGNAAVALCESLGKDYYVKEDLRAFLA